MGMFTKKNAARYGANQRTNSEGWITSLGNGKTASSVYVNENIALNFPPVWAAVNLIADVMAALPVDVLQPDGKGGTKEIPDHDLVPLLNHEINDVMDSMNARALAYQGKLLWGNGYMEIERKNSGAVAGLWPLLPNGTHPVRDRESKQIFYRTSIDGVQYDLDKDDVLHLMGPGPNGYEGWSPIRIHRETIGLGLAVTEFGAKYFANDAKSGGFFVHPGKLGEKAKVNITESEQEQKGGLANAHRVKILEEGMKFVPTTIPPEDSQFLATRQFQIEDVARIYRVPLILLQSQEKTTSWGSGIESLIIAFSQFTLAPHCVNQEQQMRRKLLTEREKAQGLKVKLNLNALLRADSAARAAFYNSGINAGWLTRNEARTKEDLNPIAGLDRPLVPANMTTSDNAAGPSNAKTLPSNT